MHAPRSAQLLDDDPVFLRMLQARLRARVPELSVEVKTDPAPEGRHDVYVIDNDFHGRPLVADIVESLKRERPESLVIALSSKLDASVLKRLVNFGCDGAFDKQSAEEMNQMLEIIAGFVGQTSASPSSSRSGLAETARAITGLLAEWNRRMGIEESRGVAGEDGPVGGAAGGVSR